MNKSKHECYNEIGAPYSLLDPRNISIVVDRGSKRAMCFLDLLLTDNKPIESPVLKCASKLLRKVSHCSFSP
jgi:hypothetical protein